MYISPAPSLPWCEFAISFQGSQCMLEGFVFLWLWNKLCWFHGNALRLQTFLFLVWCLLLFHHTTGGLDHHHLCALCPSIWLEDSKGKILFKHSTRKCHKSSYVSGFHHDIVSGLDAQYSTVQVGHAFATCGYKQTTFFSRVFVLSQVLWSYPSLSPAHAPPLACHFISLLGTCSNQIDF